MIGWGPPFRPRLKGGYIGHRNETWGRPLAGPGRHRLKLGATCLGWLSVYPPKPKIRRRISTTSMLEPCEGWLGGWELLDDEEELEEEDDELEDEELLLDELLEELDDEEEDGWPEEELWDWLEGWPGI